MASRLSDWLRGILFAALALGCGLAFARKCPNLDNDPFRPDAVFREGPFVGECVDTDFHRPVHRLTPEERALYGIGPNDGTAFANFRHDGKFSILVVPDDAVTALTLQSEPIMALVDAHHVQVRINMKPGAALKIIDQVPTAGVAPAPKVLDSDIIFSLLATGRAGDRSPFSPVAGMQKKYVSFLTFYSVSDHAAESRQKQRPVRQIRVKLDAKLSRAYLEEGINWSAETGANLTYDVARTTCVTEALCLFDKILGNTNRSGATRATQTLNFERALKSRGLYGEELAPLAQEFGYADEIPAATRFQRALNWTCSKAVHALLAPFTKF